MALTHLIGSADGTLNAWTMSYRCRLVARVRRAASTAKLGFLRFLIGTCGTRSRVDAVAALLKLGGQHGRVSAYAVVIPGRYEEQAHEIDLGTELKNHPCGARRLRRGGDPACVALADAPAD